MKINKSIIKFEKNQHKKTIIIVMYSNIYKSVKVFYLGKILSIMNKNLNCEYESDIIIEKTSEIKISRYKQIF